MYDPAVTVFTPVIFDQKNSHPWVAIFMLTWP